MRTVALWWLLYQFLTFVGLAPGKPIQGHSPGLRVDLVRSVPESWRETLLVDVDGGDEDENRSLQQRASGSTGLNGGAIGAGGVPVGPVQSQNITATADMNTTTNPAAGTTTGQLPGQISSPENPHYQVVNCSDVSTGRADRCWEELELSDYVLKWQRATTCLRGEGFSTCFLRQNGFPGLDCSVISKQGCPAIQSDLVNVDPKKFYVAYNIYAINQFFASWWQAIDSSGYIASDNISKIVHICDVPNSQSVAVQWVLIALQAIFALIPGPLGVIGGAARSGYSIQWQLSAQLISNAVAIVPNVGRFLFPTGTSDSKIIQISELSSQFAIILTQVKSNLNLTLTSVMANATEFLAFASQGNFSAGIPSLPDQANYLYYGFNTYLISQCLAGNNVVAVIGKNTNVRDLVRNGTKLNYKIDCQDYNDKGLCDAFWYSPKYDSSFTLNDFSKMNRNYNLELNQLFQNLTTGELLFESAYACNSEGGFGTPINITVSASGINTACVSQLRLYTWDMSCWPGVGLCEFLEGPSQDTFGYQSKRNQAANNEISVPYGYLGPALTQKGVYLAHS